MKKKHPSLMLISTAITVAIVAIGVAVLLIPGPEEKIVLSCNNDEDCYKSCYGCISKDSRETGEDCPIPLSLCMCVKNSCQYILSKDEIMDIIDEKYPNVEKDARLNMDCEEGPCWEINFTIGSGGGGGGSAKIKAGASSGEIIEEECAGTECKECDYLITEIMPWGEIKYYNNDCENPKPTCDVTNICRPCESKQDCLRKNVSSTIRLDIGQILSQHYYATIGNSITAHYNESDLNCTVYDSGIGIYSDIIIDIADCENEILSHINCNDNCSIS